MIFNIIIIKCPLNENIVYLNKKFYLKINEKFM